MQSVSCKGFRCRATENMVCTVGYKNHYAYGEIPQR